MITVHLVYTALHEVIAVPDGCLCLQVAECIGEAFVQDSAVNQVVEIVADEQAPTVPWDDLFSGVY